MTAMLRLDTIDVELLALILELVDDSSPSTTKAVALVNKYFNATSKLVAHRYKRIAYRRDYGKLPDIGSWFQDESLLRGVRYLTIESDSNGRYAEDLADLPTKDGVPLEGDDLEDYKWGSLAALIKNVGNLKSLVWNIHGTPPLQILEALHENHKKAELKVFDFARANDSADHTQPAEIALSKSPALTIIKAQIWYYGGGSHPDLREPAFRRIVANAPNLKSASVVTGHSGCVIYHLSPEQQAEVQKLSNKFYTHKKPNSSIRTLTLDGYGLSEHTLNDWSRFVDLSQLENLKCSRGYPDVSYFRTAPNVLINLKHVSLNLSRRDNDELNAAIENYLATCAPLKSLSLWSWNGVVPLSAILARHGPTLRTLQLHERETITTFDQGKRALLDLDDLKAIKDTCPHLKDFTFDLDRSDEKLETIYDCKDKLEVLASIDLERLQIYHDLGLSFIVKQTYNMDDQDESEAEDANEPGEATDDSETRAVVSSPPRKRQKRQKPQLIPPSTNKAIETHIRQIWKEVFGNKTTGQRILHVKFGEWERKMGSGYPAPWIISERHLRTFWQVKPELRDDRPGECAVKKSGGGLDDSDDRDDRAHAEE